MKEVIEILKRYKTHLEYNARLEIAVPDPTEVAAQQIDALYQGRGAINYHDLEKHYWHKIVCVKHGDNYIAIKCDDCNEVLIDTLYTGDESGLLSDEELACLKIPQDRINELADIANTRCPSNDEIDDYNKYYTCLCIHEDRKIAAKAQRDLTARKCQERVDEAYKQGQIDTTLLWFNRFRSLIFGTDHDVNAGKIGHDRFHSILLNYGKELIKAGDKSKFGEWNLPQKQEGL